MKCSYTLMFQPKGRTKMPKTKRAQVKAMNLTFFAVFRNPRKWKKSGAVHVKKWVNHGKSQKHMSMLKRLYNHFCFIFVGVLKQTLQKKIIQFSQSKHAPAFCIVPSLHEETHLGWSQWSTTCVVPIPAAAPDATKCFSRFRALFWGCYK